MALTERQKKAMIIAQEKPLTMNALLRFQAVLNEAEGDEARRIGLLWEPIYAVLPDELAVEWEAYRKEQKANGGR